MDHEPILTRQALVMIVILVCGLIPDRLAGHGASSLRDSFKSNLFNRADLERFERGYYEELLDQGRRLDDLADVPGLRVRRRSGSTWSIPVEQSPLVMRVDDLREVVLKRNDATERFGLQWRTNDQGMRDRNYSLKKPPGTFRVALVGDSIGAGWGVNAEDRFESILEEALERPRPRFRRRKGRDHQLRGPGAFTGPALVSLRPDRLADGARPGDLPVDRGGRRLGRTAAAVPARARPGLGLPHLPPGSRTCRRRSRSAARTSTSGRCNPGTGRSSPESTSA